MALPDFSSSQWLLAILAGFCAGFSKAGMAGLGMLTVMIMAHVIRGPASSGAVLPLLIFADVMAAGIFRQEILWPQIRKLALPILAGIAAGSVVLYYLPRDAFPPLVGWMVLGMLSLQAVRHFRPRLAEGLPHSTWFLWTV
ncbi:MAG TPA: sulfite exporter TauE/SafE family protein, partial [Verrucomicrobiales bacterium]|nr:sulfite exporter TauE/SafE family protein [Verrucomicrobiales bacterium]